MEIFENILHVVDAHLGSGLWFPYVLLGVGVFFTCYLGFPQLRYFRRAWGTLFGRHTRKDAAGDTSHFQALATALSGTVGTGNIAGVALAIHLGGPAALFWMWATAFVGMTTKFVEVTLSHKYRVRDDKGEMAGGPMYYMERAITAKPLAAALRRRGFLKLAERCDRLGFKWLAVLFAIATVVSTLGSGNMPQADSLASGLERSFGMPHWLSGGALALLLGLVIVGGIKWIARVAAAIVPLMGVLYGIGACAVLAANMEQVGPALAAVFRDAFTGSAATGGFLGASLAFALNRGVNRGLFSNEAGQGSAPIAHASARTDEPVAEGMVSLLEPFIDTLVICTLTGLVILSSGVWRDKFDNPFQPFDTEFVAGAYSDANAEDVAVLAGHFNGRPLPLASGAFEVAAGQLQAPDVTILHNRSVAEEVVFHIDGEPYTGTIALEDGALASDGVRLHGKSLLHSVPLTVEAFQRSFFGVYGQYAVTLGLVLFAFSTAIAWSYYGDRAMTYLFGDTRAVLPYRLAYVAAFFLAAFVDTSLVWLISAITLPLMALPNLLGILILGREMKQTVRDYWQRQAAAGGG